VKYRKRFVAIVAVLGVITTVLAGLAAYAATQVSAGTAKLVTSPDVFAGTAGPVTVQVSNPSGTLNMGAAVNLVVIHPGAGFAIQAPPSPAPAGWHYTLSGSDAVFSGGSIAAGSTHNFTVPTVATRPAGNLSGNWQAKSSADQGQTMVLDTTASPGTMTTVIHVLKVTAAALNAPAGATDNTVTAGQNNTTVGITVQNGGSGALSVTPKLTAGGGGDAVGAAPAASSIAGNGGTASYTFPVTFGSASGATPRHFTADATAPGAPAAIGAATPNITVQAASAFAYVANSLSPTTVPKGGRTFQLSVNKTGAPALTLTGATTTLTFQNGANHFAFPLGTNQAVGANAVTSILSFAGTVPVVPDGVYTGTLHLVGTDANGATVDKTLTVASITVDNSGPGVVPTLTTPTVDKNGKPVAKDGAVLTIGGSVFKHGSGGTLDPTATISSCKLTILGGAQALKQDVTPSCTISQGTLGGTVTLNSGGLPAGTVNITVSVKDAADNPGSAASSTVAVDNVIPAFANAVTKDPSTIVVATSEPVEGSFQAADWMINGSSAKAVTFDGSNSAFGSVITITPQSAFGPNDTPTVSYSRLEPAQLGSVHDAAGNDAPTSASMNAKDGIAPAAPVLSLVAGRSKYADTNRFYTNNSSPSLTASGLTVGDVVTFTDTTTSPALIICKTAAAQGPTAACSAAGWTANLVRSVHASSIDPSGNASTLGATETIVVDHAAPSLSSGTIDRAARTVTVTVNDLLGSGRNFAVDWQVSGSATGQPVTYAIQSVTIGSATTRVLHIDPNDPNWASGSVIGLAYAFQGSTATDRYADRAGNFLANGSIATS